VNKKAVLIVLFIIIVGLVFYLFIYNPEEKQEEQVVEVVDEIDEYGYLKQDNDSDLFISLYEELKTVLNAEVIDEGSYAELVAKMFIVDLYTIDNKLSRNDVGGTEFIHSSFVDNYELKVVNTLYKYVENDIYGDRNQQLPVVLSVNVISKEKVSYTYNDETDEDAYKIELNWAYKDDLGYESGAVLYMIHENDKLSIVEME